MKRAYLQKREGRDVIRQLISTGTVAATLALSAAAYGQGSASASGEWDELVKAAQREGEVDVIMYGGINLHKGAVQEFEKKYGIKVNYQTGSSRQHAERILAERQLGRYTVDAWMGGANTALSQLLPNGVLQPIPPLLVDPDVKDPSKWFQGKHHYTDPEHRYIFTWGASPAQNFVFNTNLVKPEEIKSYWDMLDPKWKGKIVAMPPGSQGVGAATVPLFLNPEVGEKWFRRLANEMDLTVVKDSRQGAEWVALGRFPVGLFRFGEEALELEKQGFPIQSYLPHQMKEGEALTAGGTNLMAVDKAPHPNAMKLFINWALSREAQQIFIKAARRYDSLRTDVDNSIVEPQYRIQKDADYYVPFTDPEYINRQSEILDRLNKIMEDAGYR
jgi:iron(III) transport system substrate-binding protein